MGAPRGLGNAEIERRPNPEERALAAGGQRKLARDEKRARIADPGRVPVWLGTRGREQLRVVGQQDIGNPERVRVAPARIAAHADGLADFDRCRVRSPCATGDSAAGFDFPRFAGAVTYMNLDVRINPLDVCHLALDLGDGVHLKQRTERVVRVRSDG